MKTVNLIVLSVAALLFGRPAGLCTANAAKAEPADELAELKAQLAAQNQQIKELQALATGKPEAAQEPTGVVALLAKGAGVPLSDVTWRVAAGVDPAQAVEAAIAQKQFNSKAKK